MVVRLGLAREWKTIKKVNGLREQKGRRLATSPAVQQTNDWRRRRRRRRRDGGWWCGVVRGSAGVSILFNFVGTMLRAASSLTGGILQVQKGDLKT